MLITIVGDYIEDKYTFGIASRICPEAPVPVIVPQREKVSAGGAGLVAAQLRELSVNVNTEYGSYSEKHRIFADNHLICRVDLDSYDRREIKAGDCYGDAIVVSDYGKGAMSEGLAKQLVAAGKPLFVDAKHHWDWYRQWIPNRVTIFPNEHEAYGLQIGMGFNRIVRKLGARGCNMNALDEVYCELPATVSEVVDVTGAGDIFMAGFVWAWSLGCPAEDCLRLANIQAGESCRHLGTYVVPRAFAQAELDRLRSSREPKRQAPGCSLGSTLIEPLQPLLEHPELISSVAGESDIPLAGCDPEPAIRAVALDSPRFAQTPPTVPLDPSTRLGVPAPLDQRIVDGIDRKWR